MIITMHKQATSEERTHLKALLCRITGSQHPITTTMMGDHEAIALDDQQIDAAAISLLEEQSAVARLISLKTPYQLVSRAFQTETSSILIGETHGGTPVSIGGEADPVIMAGPCAVE